MSDQHDIFLDRCKRAASMPDEAPAESLLDVVLFVTVNHGPATRQFATDRLMFLMAEYIEEPMQQAARAAKH